MDIDMEMNNFEADEIVDQSNDVDDDNVDNSNEADTDYIQCFNDDDIKDEDYLYQIPELSRIILYHGNSLADEEWMRKRVKTEFDVNYYAPSIALKESFKYMSSKTLESNEALNDYLDNFIFEIKNACHRISETLVDNDDLTNMIKDLSDEDSLTARFRAKTAVETFYAGRIRYGITNGKLNHQNIFLEAPFSISRGEIVPLDLAVFKNVPNENAKSEFSVFPGKIVVLKGHNFNGNCINVTKFVPFDKILKPDFPLKCPQVLLGQESNFNMICACGPFIKFDGSNNINPTDTTYIKAIADYLLHYNPDVLFLIGPFFHESMCDAIQKWSLDTTFDNNGFPYQWTLDRLFNYQIQSLYKEIGTMSIQTRIIIIPSSNELGKTNIYPMYPIELKSYKEILSFSNPSLLNIGGICVGLSSTDILLHMSRNEIHNIDVNKSNDGERLKRLCHHILTHRHFYPLLPPDSSLKMEYPMYHYLTMTVNPHLLILPSMLRPFIYNINGTIVINPGKVSKNTIARITVEPLKDKNDYVGSLSNYTNVEIIKLIHN